MKYYQHFCDCGSHFFCGNPIVLNSCEECGSEYIGPDCRVSRPLPVDIDETGRALCRECRERVENRVEMAVH